MSDVIVESITQQIIVNPATNVIVESITQRIIVNPATQAVSIVNAGPPGPTGAKGEPGAAGGDALNFQQPTPSDEWIINHNFGFYPNVDLYTSGGLSMWGQIVNVTLNQVRVYFTTSVAGTARLT